jgi:hypothetical protein
MGRQSEPDDGQWPPVVGVSVGRFPLSGAVSIVCRPLRIGVSIVCPTRPTHRQTDGHGTRNPCACMCDPGLSRGCVWPDLWSCAARLYTVCQGSCLKEAPHGPPNCR